MKTHTDRIGDTLIKQPNGWIDIAAYVCALKGSETELIPSWRLHAPGIPGDLAPTRS